MKLTEKEKKTLLGLQGSGHSYFTCCPLCGHLTWRMTNKEEPDDVTVEEDALGRGCMDCMEVAKRSPEIFQWVLSVVDYKIRKSEERNHPETFQTNRPW